MINLIWTAELFTNSVPELGDTDDLTLASLLTHLLALLVVSVAVALLFVAVGALLLVLVVHDGLVRHVALLLVHHPAPLLAARVVHSPASCHRELVAVLLVPDALCAKNIISFSFE